MRGFTLIELLAVIVILAIILLISVPIINNVIEGVKKSAFESSVKNIVKSGEFTYASNIFKPNRELVYTFANSEITGNYPDALLEFSGEVPISGNVIIREDGKIAASLFNGEYCASKDYNTNKVVIVDKGIDDCYSAISLPEIILNGTTPVEIEIHNNYVDLGAVAKTIGGEDITTIETKIYKDSSEVQDIDTSLKGTYRIIYTVYEKSKMNYVEREVIVADTTKPVITVPNSTSIVISEVNTFDFLAGVSVTDNSLETLSIQVSGSISRIAGSYTITYSATDSSGNTEEVTRIINVNDISAPVLTLNGASTLNLNVGDAYNELNATSLDDANGDLTSSIVKTGSVNINLPGTYFITYTSKDSSNNESSITRTVNVIDNVVPTVSYGTNGNATYAKTRSTTVTVTDNVAVQSRYYQWTMSTTAPTSGSFSQTFTNGASIATPVGVSGSYYLWIKGIDSNNNETIVRSNVFNLDNTLPTIVFGTNGNATYAKTYSTTVTVSDNVTVGSRHYQWTNSITAPTSGSFTVAFTNGANLTTPAGLTGSYYLWIKAVDTSGNELIARSNVFNLDNTNPIVTSVLSGISGLASTGFTITRSGNATDANSGIGATPYVYQTSLDNSNWTTRCTTDAASCAVSGLSADTTYYYRICANDALNNQSCIASKTQKTYKVGEGSFTDVRDGRIYKTVTIGSQVWFAEDLMYTGNGCLSASYATRWWCTSNGSSSAPSIHYQLNAALQGAPYEGTQGICPAGTHIPSTGEVQTMITYLGTNPGWKIKAPYWGGTNETGFSALPVGYYHQDRGETEVDSDSFGRIGMWYTSTRPDATSIYYFYMHSIEIGMNIYTSNFYTAGNSYAAISIRCLKN